MNSRRLTPTRALQHCLDALLRDIQVLLATDSMDNINRLKATKADGLPRLFSRLAAASRFLGNNNGATLCRDLCRDWQLLQTTTGVSRDRRILMAAGRCREGWQADTADDLLRYRLNDRACAILDIVAAGTEEPAPEPEWLQQTIVDCRTLAGATCFLANVTTHCVGPPPESPRALLRWLLMLQQLLAGFAQQAQEKSRGKPPAPMPQNTAPDAPVLFRRELQRCLDACCRMTPGDGLPAMLWHLQLLAGALQALARMQYPRCPADFLTRHCHDLIVSAAQAQQQRSGAGEINQQRLCECLRHAMVLIMQHSPGGIRECADTGASPVGTSESRSAGEDLPDQASASMQALVAIIADQTGPTVDWAAVSLRLYRLLVCLRLTGGGFVDTGIGCSRYPQLSELQTLIASLHASVDHCLQRSVVTDEDQHRLLALLQRLAHRLRGGSGPDARNLLPDVLLLAARLNVRAQRHWQRLTLALDAAQQDFAGVSVQQVLATGLHCLPAMDGAACRDGFPPQDVLRDLRLLLKGAHILNVQRIESLVLVMIEVYEEMLAVPAFAAAADIGKALPRAHRSLCRMLDQAAAWQAPGNARRMINTLYGCLERARGSSRSATAHGCAAQHDHPTLVSERPAGQANDPWRLCLANNRRLRKLLRHQRDLDSIRVLLLELLRSQEDIMRRQADYGATPDASQG